MKISCVYKITCKGNGRFYIGGTRDFKQRRWDHLKALRAGGHYNKLLQSAFLEYGEVAFVFEVVELCEPSKLLSREQYWLDSTDASINGMNISPFAGSGFKGRKWGIEDREKMSVRMKEWVARNGNTFEGRTHTEETKRRLSERSKCNVGFLNGFFGKKHSNETREHLSRRHHESGRMKGEGNVMFGKTHSKAARESISRAQAGKFSFLDPAGKRVDIVNLKKFCRENGLSSSAMGSVLKGRVNHHVGWTPLICS